MLSKSAFVKISKSYASYAIERRKVFAASDELLAKAKQAIFALHRDDVPAAKALLVDIETGENKFAAVFKLHPGLESEGPHRAMIEEYVEAKQFLAFIEDRSMGDIKELTIDADAMLGGLSDCVGEMSRKAVQWATQGQNKKVQVALEAGREIVAQMIGMNLTGYLRNKLDQSKQALRRIEDVAYDLSIHRGVHE